MLSEILKRTSRSTTYTHNGTRIGIDGILVPNGAILPVQPGLVSDFWTAPPKELGSHFNSPEIQDNCDAGCAGYDTCFLP